MCEIFLKERRANLSFNEFYLSDAIKSAENVFRFKESPANLEWRQMQKEIIIIITISKLLKDQNNRSN